MELIEEGNVLELAQRVIGNIQGLAQTHLLSGRVTTKEAEFIQRRSLSDALVHDWLKANRLDHHVFLIKRHPAIATKVGSKDAMLKEIAGMPVRPAFGFSNGELTFVQARYAVKQGLNPAELKRLATRNKQQKIVSDARRMRRRPSSSTLKQYEAKNILLAKLVDEGMMTRPMANAFMESQTPAEHIRLYVAQLKKQASRS